MCAHVIVYLPLRWLHTERDVPIIIMICTSNVEWWSFINIWFILNAWEQERENNKVCEWHLSLCLPIESENSQREICISSELKIFFSSVCLSWAYLRMGGYCMDLSQMLCLLSMDIKTPLIFSSHVDSMQYPSSVFYLC